MSGIGRASGAAALAVAVFLSAGCEHRSRAPDAGAAPRGAVEAAPAADAGPSSGPDAAAEEAPAGPPVVGMSGYVILPGTRGDNGLGAYRVTRTYPQALLGAGAMPVHLLPVPEDEVPALLDHVDGLLLCGGPDIDPATYGEEPHPSVERAPEERERFDLALAREAMRRQMPVLGICLGAQELNVARGGSLVQDLPTELGTGGTHRQTEIPAFRRGVHEVTAVPGTRIAALYGEATFRVNSAHHQACDVLGQGLRLAARAPDGVVEAFDDPDYPFLVGVQFHPEAQTDPPGQHEPLFRAFVEAAAAYRVARRQRASSAGPSR